MDWFQIQIDFMLNLLAFLMLTHWPNVNILDHLAHAESALIEPKSVPFPRLSIQIKKIIHPWHYLKWNIGFNGIDVAIIAIFPKEI